MNRTFCKFSSVFMMFILMSCLLSTTSYAISSTDPVRDDSAILKEIGFPDEIIEVMPSIDKQDIIAAYSQDPTYVQVSNSTLVIDVLSQIAEFSTKTEEELLLSGYSQEQISAGKTIIRKYNESPDSELLESGLSDQEVSSLRSALRGKVEPRGQISTKKLTFTLASVCHTEKDTDYFISAYFNWQSPYMWTIYDDKICFAWGGNLQHRSDTQGVNYYHATSVKFTDYMGIGYPSYPESTVNAMGIYTFPQGYASIKPGASGCAQTGNITFSGTDISPGIAIGTGYDTAYDEVNIIY